MKTDFYFKFTSEAAMNTALSSFFFQPSEGDAYLLTHSESHDFDIIGTIYKPTGNTLTDADGIEYPEMAAESGWHVNLRIVGDARRADAEALDETYGVSPTTPSRVWA